MPVRQQPISYQAHYRVLAKWMVKYYEDEDSKNKLNCGCETAQKNHHLCANLLRSIKNYIKSKKNFETFNCLTLHMMFTELKKFDDGIYCLCKEKSPAPSTSGL
uniref:SWIM-type domain-containing protein n=1 Tax=Parastrongyloides trichosuri TaxID=131310 RepID=A0A0N4Z500_PARTI